MNMWKKLLLVMICLCLLTVPASAVTGAKWLESDAVVASDGSCRMVMRIEISLAEKQELTIYLPLQAQEVRLDGRYRTPVTEEQRLRLETPAMNAGTHTLEISYNLPATVTQKGEKLLLQLPLLWGFEYPVDEMRFSVTLPGQTEEKPMFVSGYHGQSIATMMEYVVEGNRISGRVSVGLKDRETLMLELNTDREMFPDVTLRQPIMNIWQLLLTLLLGTSCLYYLVALMPKFSRKVRCFGPPEGIAAGEVGTCLTGCGTDLTMMVFTWAQLGYLQLEMDKRGAVRMVKRMEMGNERSDFENQCFRNLFSRNTVVDGQSLHYALLCRKLSVKAPLLRQIYKSHSGNPLVVRILVLAAGAVGGVMQSFGFYTAGAGTVFLALGMMLLCLCLSYLIQTAGRSFSLGSKLPVWLGLGCAAVWLGLGWWGGNVLLAGGMVLCQLMAGLFSCIGGRRSELGLQYQAELRGLRAHLTGASVFDMQQILQRNCDYFFELMPYALALGVEQPFARRFGKVTLPECSYLTMPETTELTPVQWAGILRQVANRLNHRQKRLGYERLMQQAGQIVKSK